VLLCCVKTAIIFSYVVVAFVICITLNDVCICSLLLMKRVVSTY
jgi:hypothetical protein